MKVITRQDIEEAIKQVEENNQPVKNSERHVILWGCAQGLAYENLMELLKKEIIRYCGIPPHMDEKSNLPRTRG